MEAMALTDKQGRVFDEWVNKKIEAMYVFIDPDYRNLKFTNKKWIK